MPETAQAPYGELYPLSLKHDELYSLHHPLWEKSFVPPNIESRFYAC